LYESAYVDITQGHIDKTLGVLVLSVKATQDDEVTLTIPRSLIDAKLPNGSDDAVYVLLDGAEVSFETSSNSQSRVIVVIVQEGTDQIEVFGTVVLGQSIIDSDGDGIVDSSDSCPNSAEDFDEYQDSDGCPEENPPPPPVDSDGDGIVDSSDSCPNSAEDFDEYQDSDGCPEENPNGIGPEIYAVIAIVIVIGVGIAIFVARRKKRDGESGETGTGTTPPPPESDYSLDDSKMR
jgi:hypothetical protein